MVAEEWDELSPQQFLAVIKVVTSGLEMMRAKLLLLQILMRMNWWRFIFIRSESLAALLYLTDWIEDNGDISSQLVPVIYTDGLKLHGPAGNFDNVKAAEFHFADMYYTQWKATGDNDALYSFLATLYRKAKPNYNASIDVDGDIRTPFNPNTTAYYANRMRALASDQIKGIMMCYECWRRNLENDHPRIFTKENRKQAINLGWFPVFRGIAGGNKYGDVDKVEQMYMHTLMTELELLKDEEERLKRDYPELFKKK